MNCFSVLLSRPKTKGRPFVQVYFRVLQEGFKFFLKYILHITEVYSWGSDFRHCCCKRIIPLNAAIIALNGLLSVQRKATAVCPQFYRLLPYWVLSLSEFVLFICSLGFSRYTAIKPANRDRFTTFFLIFVLQISLLSSHSLIPPVPRWMRWGSEHSLWSWS